MVSTNIISPLFTDFYELTMMAGFHNKKMNQPSAFYIYLRPDKKRNYFVAAGIETAINYIENLKFSPEEISYLKSLNTFEPSFINWLENFKFSGEIHAMEEGTVFFGNEPVMEIYAPLMEAQLLETILVNTINFETMIATKASRCIHAAQQKPLSDFALRRTQGTDAGVKVSRACYLTGFSGTCNPLAGKIYDIPVTGTMAHSFVTAFGEEEEAFLAFSETFPENSILLIDTYDTLKGAQKAAEIGKKMELQGKKLKGVRLDSGDMTSLSKEVRKILNSNGLEYVKIFASSGFDEYKIAKTIEDGAQIDAFGVGTTMGVSADSPYHDTVYKLCYFNGRNVKKFSKNKTTLAGKKQVFRAFDSNGKIKHDIIGTNTQTIENTTPLLKPIIINGKRVNKAKSTQQLRNEFKNKFVQLDSKYKDIHSSVKAPVSISKELLDIQPCR